MKKVIGIFCGNCWFDNWDEITIRENGGGGSETWAIEMAEQFQKLGFHCIVFGQPEQNHFSKEGVEYVKSEDFFKRCEYQHFDYFISSRLTWELTPDLPCNNVYLMCHDTEVQGSYDDKILKLDRVKKLALLSEWQERIYKANYKTLQDKQIFKTHNGVDTKLYEDVDVDKKENLMIWSSCKERGLGKFIKYIYPLIKQEIPDFRVKICQYGKGIEGYELPEGVEFIGKQKKQDLAELQKKAKILCYPNIGIADDGCFFHETFCITAVENALAKNAIVCFKAGGIVNTLEGYDGMFLGECFNNLDFPYLNYNEKEMCEKLAYETINLLKNEDLRRQKGEELYNICKKYTWKNAVFTWLKEWGLLYE